MRRGIGEYHLAHNGETWHIQRHADGRYRLRHGPGNWLTGDAALHGEAPGSFSSVASAMKYAEESALKGGLPEAPPARPYVPRKSRPHIPPAEMAGERAWLVEGDVEDVEYLGGGVNATYSGYIGDRKVVMKPRTPGDSGLRENINEDNAPEHNAAAGRIADHLGVLSQHAALRPESAGDLIPDHEDEGFAGDEDMQVIEWIDGTTFNSYGRAPAMELEDAVDLMVFDYLIGNTDRHGENLVVQDGPEGFRFGAIDHDLSFPIGDTDGNSFGTSPSIAGMPLPASVHEKLGEIYANWPDWQAWLTEDGLTETEIEGFKKRLRKVFLEKRIPDPSDFGYGRSPAAIRAEIEGFTGEDFDTESSLEGDRDWFSQAEAELEAELTNLSAA